ncbi:MAG: hypothetical protein AAFP76_13790 [Bacteroidota bacterium]
MRKTIFLSLWALPLMALSQDRVSKVNYSTLDRTAMTTSILLEEPSPFSVLTSETNRTSMFILEQSYEDLSKADSQGRFSNLGELQSRMRPYTMNETIFIGGFHTQFETISEEALSEGKIQVASNGDVSTNSSDYIFQSYSRTLMAPLSFRKTGLSATFYVDENLFVNTTANVITDVQIDFDNGSGYTSVNFNDPIPINYTLEGTKELSFKVVFQDSTEAISNAQLQVRMGRQDEAQSRNFAQQDLFGTIAPDLSIYPSTPSTPGMAEYEIFLGADGVLDKPVIVVDGFDPADSRNIADVYQLLEYTDSGGATQNLADKIRNEEDYDVVILNFPRYLRLVDNSLMNLNQVTDTNGDMIIDENDYPPGSTLVDGGVDFIERNAMIFVELIQLINSQKTGCQQNVVIGPSMGGLISRFGLTYMEQNALDHDTRLWLSIDSPHYGANVPIGLQLLFYYFGYGYGDSDSVKLLVEGMLRSPAARQMLVDHFDAHMDPINPSTDDPVSPSPGKPYTPEGAPQYRDNFQNRMNAVGFPTDAKKVSIANGSGLGAAFQDINGNDVLPGFDLIDSNIDTGDVIIFINTRAVTFCEYMPSAGIQEKIVDVKIQAQFFFWITQDTFIADAESFAFTDGVDSAPGGLFDIFALADSLGGDPVLTNFLNAMNAGYFNFIPVTSSLGLANQPDYYAIPDPNNGANENISPFDSWYIPPTNEGHVVLTDANVQFAWAEIVTNVKSNISARTFLQGAYGPGLMNDDLRSSGLIPSTSPYADALTCDPNIFTITGADALVDWVYVELRDATDSSNVIAGQSAFIQRDGDIVAVDGTSQLSFDVLGADYYVAIQHRNHLGILTSHPVCLSHRTTSLDLSSNSTSVQGGANALSDLGSGVFGMVSGDLDANGQIQNKDLQAAALLLGNTGYSSADMDLNGAVDNSDLTVHTTPNLGKGRQFD